MILCLNVELELKAEKENAEIRLKDPRKYQEIIDAEWKIIYDKLDLIVQSDAQVILSRLAIGDLATQYFADQNDIGINGWAIEARVYAEDPFKGFLPQIGILNNYKEPFPNDSNIRTDTGIQEDAEISVHYDPMISKLIVLNKMKDSLDSYIIHGLNHNIPFLPSILHHPRFINGNINTKFIEQEYIGGFGMELIKLNENDEIYTIIRSDLTNKISQLNIELNDKVYDINIGEINKVETNYNIGDFVFESIVENNRAICQLISQKGPNQIELQYKGLKFEFQMRFPQEEELFKYVSKPEIVDLERVLLAPMPGNIFSINVKIGQHVVSGQEACVIEAMKMQNIFYVQKDGIVKNVHVKQGDSVAAQQKIYEIE